MYDLTSKKLKKVSSEPYESQYPLSTYDYKNNKVYSPLEVLLVKNVGNVDVQY